MVKGFAELKQWVSSTKHEIELVLNPQTNKQHKPKKDFSSASVDFDQVCRLHVPNHETWRLGIDNPESIGDYGVYKSS